MADDLHEGDRVEWSSHGGRAVGRVERKVTEDTKIKGHQARASEDDPQYVVRSDKSGATAVHHPEALDEAD